MEQILWSNLSWITFIINIIPFNTGCGHCDWKPLHLLQGKDPADLFDQQLVWYAVRLQQPLPAGVTHALVCVRKSTPGNVPLQYEVTSDQFHLLSSKVAQDVKNLHSIYEKMYFASLFFSANIPTCSLCLHSTQNRGWHPPREAK